MTPEDLAKQLAELHEQTLSQLNAAIIQHREYLHGLIQQAREELHSLASADTLSAETQQEQADGLHDVTDPAAAGAAAVRGVKRKTVGAVETAAKPAKRRGRPPKQPKQPVIVEAAEEEEEEQAKQQLGLCDSQQHSVSVTLVAEVDDVATAEEATSAPAATRRRSARTRSATASAEEGAKAPTSGRNTRRRGTAADVELNAPPASSGRSKRGRKGAATTMPAAEQLEAIVEEDEQPDGEQQQVLQHDEDTAQMLHATAAVKCDDRMQETAPELQHLQEQQELGALAISVDAVTAEYEATQSQDDELIEDQAEAADAAAANSTAPFSADDFEEPEAKLPGAAADDDTASPAADSIDRQHTPGGVRTEDDAVVSLLQPAVAEPRSAVRPVPKTPGFSLLPGSARKHDTDTPRFVGFASRTSTLGLQQEPVAAASSGDCVLRLSDASAGLNHEQQQETHNTSQRRPAGPKPQSLSFGQPLEGPLLEDAAVGEAGIAASELADVGDADDAEQSAAAGAMGWKAFMSTVRADAAPTPALMRQRQRSSAAASSAYQHQATQADMPAAAAKDRLEHDVVQQQDSSPPPTAVTAKAPELSAFATGPSSCRRVTRSSMRHEPASSTALGLEAAEAGTAGEHADLGINSTPASCRKGKPARSPRPTPPRCTKRRVSAQATPESAGGQADDASAEQQQMQVTASAGGVLGSAEQQEGHEQAHDVADGQDVEQHSGHADDMEQEPDEMQGTEREPAVQHDNESEEQIEAEQQVQPVTAGQTCADADSGDTATVTKELAAQAASSRMPISAATNSSKAADPMSAWLAATAVASSGAAGDQAKQQLESAKDNKAAAVGGRSNLVSGIRSFVPAAAKKEAPAIAAGKVKVKVKALEAAEAARRAEEAKAQERAARQQQLQEQQQSTRPQGTPSAAVAQSRVAAVERVATGLSGSGGAVRVPAKQPNDDSHKPADSGAAQRKAEKEAETAKRALDKAEREERMKRAEQKRKEEEQKRRQDLAEKQRLREERAAAAAAARGAKAAASKAAAAGGARGAEKAHDNKGKQQTASVAASDPSNFKTPAAPKAVTRVGAATAAGGGDGCAGASSDSPSLTIKLLDPVSTGGKAKNTMGPPAPVGGKTPAAFKTPAPPVSEQEKRNVEALKNSPYVNTGTKRTPYSQQKLDPNSYIISPFRDDDVETPDRSHKPIPDWARSHVLFEALKAQQHTDPDTIFGARQNTCDLADMFADVPSAAPPQHQRHKVRKLGQRTSSADWSQDRLTWQEEVKYKKDMGYL